MSMSKQSWLFALALALGGVLLTEAPIEGGVLDASWTAPTTNTDGTPLTDLASYLVYYSTAASPCPASSFLQVASPTSSPDPDQTVSARLTGLITGTRYYVSVSSINIAAKESDCSPPADAVARDDFPEGPILNVAPTSVPARESVTATWSGIAAPTPTDWVGLYAEGAAGGAYLAWIYVSCSQTPGPAHASGSCVIQIPPIARPGRYELRLYAANMFTRLATSSRFMVPHRHR
jgi:hypothetical protein